MTAPEPLSIVAAARTVGRLRWLVTILIVIVFGGASAVTFTSTGQPQAFTPASTVLVGAALLLILAASRVQTVVQLRGARLERLTPGALLAGYAQGIVASWLLLAVAAGLGFAVALLTHRAATAWVFAAATALGMVARWPRRPDLLRRLGAF